MPVSPASESVHSDGRASLTRCGVPPGRSDHSRPGRSLNSIVLPTQVTSHGMVSPAATEVTVGAAAARLAAGEPIRVPATRAAAAVTLSAHRVRVVTAGLLSGGVLTVTPSVQTPQLPSNATGARLR